MKAFKKPFHPGCSGGLRPPLAAILGTLIVLSVAGCSALGASQTSAIQASGVIEATQVDVSPELSGRVAQVSAKEGDAVKRGDELLRLDGSLLQAQRKVAAANLDAARICFAQATDAFLHSGHAELAQQAMKHLEAIPDRTAA